MIGALTGEVIRRVTGRTIRQWYSLADPRTGVGYSHLRNRFSAGAPENAKIPRAVADAR